MPIPEKTPNWKDIFRENQNLNSNWDSGTAKVVECFGHTDRVLSLTLQGERMATGSLDKTIRVWDVHDGRCLLVLKGHSKGIWCLRFYAQNLLISASYDHTIRVSTLKLYLLTYVLRITFNILDIWIVLHFKSMKQI